MPRVAYGAIVSVPRRTGGPAGIVAPSSLRGSAIWYCSIVRFPNGCLMHPPASSATATSAIHRCGLLTDAWADDLLRGLAPVEDAARSAIEPVGASREILRCLREIPDQVIDRLALL